MPDLLSASGCNTTDECIIMTKLTAKNDSTVIHQNYLLPSNNLRNPVGLKPPNIKVKRIQKIAAPQNVPKKKKTLLEIRQRKKKSNVLISGATESLLGPKLKKSP